jgi:hypothetical protein
VTIRAALAADLGLLTEALDRPGVDIEATLEQLVLVAAQAIPSYLGLTVSLVTRDDDLAFSTLTHENEIARITTSVRIPLGPRRSSPDPEGPGSVLILYASVPGAFVDLAADLAWLTSRALQDVRLDDDVTAASVRHLAPSLSDRSSIDQAIGVLIGRGRTSGEARDELTDLATASDVTLASAACALLASIAPPPSRDGERSPPEG